MLAHKMGSNFFLMRIFRISGELTGLSTLFSVRFVHNISADTYDETIV